MSLIKRLTGFSIAGILSFAFMSPTIAAPVIGIGSMYDVLLPEMQSMTKRIYNTGDSTAFVRVEILEINPGGEKGAVEKAQKEMSGKTLEQNRLIVTPQRLIIPPGGFQTVRILWPGVRDTEKYFRVRFTPVMPELNDGFGMSSEAASDYRKNSLHAGLNVLTGYGTIVIVQPGKPKFDTLLSKDASGRVVIRNNGDTTISLDDIRHCKTANTDCTSTTREFVLPGKTHTVESKTGYKTIFTLVEGGSKRVLSY